MTQKGKNPQTIAQFKRGVQSRGGEKKSRIKRAIRKKNGWIREVILIKALKANLKVDRGAYKLYNRIESGSRRKEQPGALREKIWNKPPNLKKNS